MTQTETITATGGEAIATVIAKAGVEHVFCVPGESYLPVLDALYDRSDRARVISCRHESGAAFMACANARLRGRAGVCLVTRGPGATNAAIALHVAQQASIPLVVLVGQVEREFLGRESFQEVDYVSLFSTMVKDVCQVEDENALAGAMSRAFKIAEGGRQGPVVVACPEDVLGASASSAGAVYEKPQRVQPTPDETGAVLARLRASERPLIIVGGGDWRDEECAALERFANRHGIPVATAFRRHDLFDNRHRCFAGVLGLGTPDAVWSRVETADCVLVLGARLDEPTTRAYQLFRNGLAPSLIHVYPDSDTIGLNYEVDLSVVAHAGATADALASSSEPEWTTAGPWCESLAACWRDLPPPDSNAGGIDLAAVMTRMNARLPEDTIVTGDAGNFSIWPQRCRAYARPGRLLAPINGAMGFGVPAAVGAALTEPARRVVGCVGDGGMLMTGNELATAVQYGASPLIIVFNNNRYGTIEMHQARLYPGRNIGTTLYNPDFVMYARSFGLFGARVATADDFESALDDALAFDGPALLELEVTGY